jgi:hypothetical protein
MACLHWAGASGASREIPSIGRRMPGTRQDCAHPGASRAQSGAGQLLGPDRCLAGAVASDQTQNMTGPIADQFASVPPLAGNDPMRKRPATGAFAPVLEGPTQPTIQSPRREGFAVETVP